MFLLMSSAVGAYYMFPVDIVYRRGPVPVLADEPDSDISDVKPLGIEIKNIHQRSC